MASPLPEVTEAGGATAQAAEAAPVMSFWTDAASDKGQEQGAAGKDGKDQQAKAKVWQLLSILGWLLGWNTKGGAQDQGPAAPATGATDQTGPAAPATEQAPAPAGPLDQTSQTGPASAGGGAHVETGAGEGVRVEAGSGASAQVTTDTGQAAEVRPTDGGAVEVHTDTGETLAVQPTGGGEAHVETGEGERVDVRPAESGVEVETADGPSTEIRTEGGGRAEEVAEDAPGKPGGPEIDATSQALGKHVAGHMDQANNGPHTLDKGIHYSYNYEALCKRLRKPERWNDDYRTGYANPTYFEKVGFMDWVLKPGQSASAAIKAWLEGVTIAECNSSVVAMHIDALRAAIGDEKFDDMFGSPNKTVPAEQRLRIKPGTDGTPVEQFMKRTELAQKKGWYGKATDKEMDESLQVGEWYYFYNHPKYLLKHPGGAWQGENALYMGRQGGQRIWSGLGASGMTEEGMMEEMVYAYNAPRDEHDERVMRELGIKNADGTYADRRYDPKSGEFEETITKHKILNDPPYTLHGTTRKGGFLVGAGITLDAEKIKKLRDQPDE